jgi:hypothetical protein
MAHFKKHSDVLFSFLCCLRGLPSEGLLPHLTRWESYIADSRLLTETHPLPGLVLPLASPLILLRLA